MHNGRPLSPRTSEADQLDQIFRHLGTPNEAEFPGIVDLPDYKVGALKHVCVWSGHASLGKEKRFLQEPQWC